MIYLSTHLLEFEAKTNQGSAQMESDPLIQFFAFEHLPPHLREISEPFGALADAIVAALPDNKDRHKSLRRLLEAKDWAIRSRLHTEPK